MKIVYIFLLLLVLPTQVSALKLTKLNVDLKKAKELQTNYFHKYNTSLNGLMIHHEIDPKEFLDFVHDIDLSFLKKDTALISKKLYLFMRTLKKI